MSSLVPLLLLTFGLSVAGLEEVPRASAIRAETKNGVRRSPPVYKPNDAAPRAHAFKRTSTGVRRAPHRATAPPSVVKQPKPMRAPLSMSAIPLPAMVPMNIPMVTFPPMMSIPTLPTFATIAMPTLPTLTMPPSFQRLMGITTTPAAPRKTKHRKSEEYEVEEEEQPKRRRRPSTEESIESNASRGGLSPVSSRLPKFVNSRKVPVIAPESNADWIVPF